MEDTENSNSYTTTPHKNEDLDFIFNQESEDLDDVIFAENRDLVHDFKMYLRLFRKKFSSVVREKMQKNFTVRSNGKGILLPPAQTV